MKETTKTTLIDYYAKRAAEYESIYARPERQADLQMIVDFLSGAFSGEQVLEIACGTGYWTRFIARSAKAIFATDYNWEVIELARQKDFRTCRVQFAQADAYQLDSIPGGHTMGFHGFWWSHIPLRKIDEFLAVFHARLTTAARVVMIDNAYVEGSSTPISKQDEEGNTYQIRRLKDGSEHEVLKNFPSEMQLRELLSAYSTEIHTRFLQYFWIAEYKIR